MDNNKEKIKSDKKIYFVSDIHFGAENNMQKKMEKLNKVDMLFSKILSDGEKVYLLGDIFDFWFDYRYAIQSKNFELLSRIYNLVKHGVEVHYIGGNHDYWLGKTIEELGIIPHRKPIEISIDGKSVFLAHGDGFAASDWGYKYLLSPVLRCPFFIFLFRLIHPDLATILGKIVSSKSREHTTGRSEKFIKEYEDHVSKLVKNKDYDIVIHGHTHVPRAMKISDTQYFDTGDFFKSFSFVEYNNGEYSLKYI